MLTKFSRRRVNGGARGFVKVDAEVGMMWKGFKGSRVLGWTSAGLVMGANDEAGGSFSLRWDGA